MVNQELVEAFGKRIRQLRTDRGISQEELSFLTGFHRTYIGMIERGKADAVDLNKEKGYSLISKIGS